MKPMKLLTAEWCGSCVNIKKFLEDNDYNKVDVMDIDVHPHVARSANIRGVPSLVLASGEVVYGPSNIIRFIKENYDADTNS